MAKVLGFLIRYFNNYYTLHRSDLAARAAPLDPRLPCTRTNLLTCYGKDNVWKGEFENSFRCDCDMVQANWIIQGVREKCAPSDHCMSRKLFFVYRNKIQKMYSDVNCKTLFIIKYVIKLLLFFCVFSNFSRTLYSMVVVTPSG